MRTSLASLFVALALGIGVGCTTSSVHTIPERSKAEVRAILAPGFKFPEGKEEITYSLLLEASRHLDREDRVDKVWFRDATHAAVYLSAKGFSIHGGPVMEAVWDRGEWKFGAKWSYS